MWDMTIKRFIGWVHITRLYTGDNCLNFVRKREAFPVSYPVFSSLSLSLHSTDAAVQSSGNPQWPEGDDIILEQLRLTQYRVFCSNHIAMSFPISSDHLNPLIIYQQQWDGVYRKSPEYLVLYCTLCLVLINLCGGRALKALAATVMRVCLVWRLCRTNADGLYGCRSGLALTHTGWRYIEGATGSFICKIMKHNTVSGKQT